MRPTHSRAPQEAGAFMGGQKKYLAVSATSGYPRAAKHVILAASILAGAGVARADSTVQAVMPVSSGIDSLLHRIAALAVAGGCRRPGCTPSSPTSSRRSTRANTDRAAGLAPVADVTSSTATFTLMKYGITDHLSIEVDPQTQINQEANGGFNSGSQIADLPVELEYRFLDQDKKTGKPSITFSAGVDVPTGRYQNLYSSFDGQGSGTYRARLGLVAQSLLYGQSQHPVRIRVWLDGAVPLGGVGINNISVFGTSTGFTGTGYSGISGVTGMSVEYSFTQRPRLRQRHPILGQPRERRLRVHGRQVDLPARQHLRQSAARAGLRVQLQRLFRHHRRLRVLGGGSQHLAGRAAADRLQLRPRHDEADGRHPAPVHRPAGRPEHQVLKPGKSARRVAASDLLLRRTRA